MYEITHQDIISLSTQNIYLLVFVSDLNKFHANSSPTAVMSPSRGKIKKLTKKSVLTVFHVKFTWRPIQLWKLSAIGAAGKSGYTNTFQPFMTQCCGPLGPFRAMTLSPGCWHWILIWKRFHYPINLEKLLTYSILDWIYSPWRRRRNVLLPRKKCQRGSSNVGGSTHRRRCRKTSYLLYN